MISLFYIPEFGRLKTGFICLEMEVAVPLRASFWF